MQQPLTDKQGRVLDYIISYTVDHGCPPSLREVSAHINVKGTATAIAHLEALEKKGYINRREGSSRSISIVGQKTANSFPVPLVGRVKAGLPSPAIEDVQEYYNVDASWLHGDGCFFLRVQGDSMVDAGIYDGDLALISPQQTADNGQIVVAKVNGEATLKRFYLEKEHIRLQPENSTMMPIIINAGEAETVIVGRLLKVVRDFA